MEKLVNIHPGEVLLEDFLKPLGISQRRLARELGLSRYHVNEIVRGARPITDDTAQRFSHYFGTSVEVWMNLQAGHDRRSAR